MKKISMILCALLITISVSAQKKKRNAKVSIEVDGVCMMCKTRLAVAALQTTGVPFASWPVKTHQLSLIIDERKTDTLKIQKKMASVGHDTKAIKAKDEVYNAIDPCCKYRDEQVVKDHIKQ